ncbi:beta transducin [Bonamia ostreae]|uniref:Beta transducin n=1 Tax=Bonamia ostreae TaxID=126728 RepID=A0ABV2AJV1_9EUKA
MAETPEKINFDCVRTIKLENLTVGVVLTTEFEDSDLAVIGLKPNLIKLIDLNGDKELQGIKVENGDKLTAMSNLGKYCRIATGYSNGEVKFWRLRNDFNQNAKLEFEKSFDLEDQINCLQFR